MSFGKLYTFAGNPRVIATRAVAKAYNIDLQVVELGHGENTSKDYLKISPMGQVPAFEGADGFTLTESLAIAIYVTSQNEKTTLLGKTKQDYASILRWMSFANQEIVPKLGGWIRPIVYGAQYNKKVVDEHIQATSKVLGVLEQHLLVHTFLVGERLTLADMFAASLVSRGFANVFDKKWRAEHPNVTRWYETVYHQPIYSAVVGDLNFIDEAIKFQPPKKEQAPKKEAAPKAATPKAKAKPAADDDEEEEDQPAPKAKHPLEELGKPTMVLDDWKRKYSNDDFRTIAMPWFWEHFKAEEYSLWRVDYAYNDELSQVFMSANLIGGFFARLEASRKYIFGAASVYGKANESVIVGAFLIRGQDARSAFDVAPDYESYKFTKLDPSKDKDKEFLADVWDMEKDVTVDGKDYPWADGKVFK